MQVQGTLKKLRSELVEPVQYQLPVGEDLVPLNDYFGKHITLTFSGNIFCSNCGKKTRKATSGPLLCLHESWQAATCA